MADVQRVSLGPHCALHKVLLKLEFMCLLHLAEKRGVDTALIGVTSFSKAVEAALVVVTDHKGAVTGDAVSGSRIFGII